MVYNYQQHQIGNFIDIVDHHYYCILLYIYTTTITIECGQPLTSSKLNPNGLSTKWIRYYISGLD